ncbi:MAG: hypothetical protein QXZ12_06910 [Thermoplasmata archaeon]
MINTNNDECENKIDTELNKRIKDMKDILNGKNILENINISLSYDKVIHYKLELSYSGLQGLQDYFEFVCDEDYFLLEITYHWMNLGCHASRMINPESMDFKVLEQIFNYIILN